MTTVTAISTAIKNAIDTLADVDQSSLNSYLPPTTTQKVALVMPAMGMSGAIDAPVGLKTEITHRIPCELWTKVFNGDLPNTMLRAREVCLDAAAEVQATATPQHVLGLTGSGSYFGTDRDGTGAFTWSVDNEIYAIGNLHFIRAVLFVTVTEWVTLTA